MTALCVCASPPAKAGWKGAVGEAALISGLRCVERANGSVRTESCGASPKGGVGQQRVVWASWETRGYLCL